MNDPFDPTMNRREFLLRGASVGALAVGGAPLVAGASEPEAISRAPGAVAVDARLAKRQLDSREFTLSVYDSIRPSLGFNATTRSEAEGWQAEARAKLIELLGGFPERVPLEPEVLETVDLGELVATVRDDVDVELRLVGARFEVRSRLPAVLAERERLRIALRNLVRNAVQHRRPDVALVIALRAWRRGAIWTLTLSDNGAGIPRGERARVFAPLQRASNATAPGGGLGLTLARQAIEACGGSIAVSSRPGVGTSFAITLRAAPRSDASASRSSRG